MFAVLILVHVLSLSACHLTSAVRECRPAQPKSRETASLGSRKQTPHIQVSEELKKSPEYDSI